MPLPSGKRSTDMLQKNRSSRNSAGGIGMEWMHLASRGFLATTRLSCYLGLTLTYQRRTRIPKQMYCGLNFVLGIFSRNASETVTD